VKLILAVVRELRSALLSLIRDANSVEADEQRSRLGVEPKVEGE